MQANSKYTRFASLVITTLVASPEGIRFLAEDKLLKQIADGLALLDPASPSFVLCQDMLIHF